MRLNLTALGYDRVQGGDGDDLIRVNKFNGTYTVEKIDGGQGVNILVGTAFNDIINLSATELVNIASIDGGVGNDSLTGSAGNDVIIGAAGSDLLSGGEGDDVFLINSSDSGYDRFQGDAGFDRVQGGDGDDLIRVNKFNGTYTVEKIDGGQGVNILVGTAFNDIINLSATELVNIASIDGGAGNDSLTGSTGNDVIIGAAGSDLLSGGAGDDVFLINGSDSGYDRFQGDAGFDVIQGSTGDDVIRVNNFSGVYALEQIDGGLGHNLLVGTQYNDIIDLTGTELVNIASIEGGAGNDRLIGSHLGDIIDGGLGKDILTGGLGIEHFRFTSALGTSNVDTLTDFIAGIDKIDLSKAIFTAFNELKVGSDLGNFEIGNHLLYNSNTGALSYDADGLVGTGAAVQIAMLGMVKHPIGLQGMDFNIVD